MGMQRIFEGVRRGRGERWEFKGVGNLPWAGPQKLPESHNVSPRDILGPMEGNILTSDRSRFCYLYIVLNPELC